MSKDNRFKERDILEDAQIVGVFQYMLKHPERRKRSEIESGMKVPPARLKECLSKLKGMGFIKQIAIGNLSDPYCKPTWAPQEGTARQVLDALSQGEMSRSRIQNKVRLFDDMLDKYLYLMEGLGLVESRGSGGERYFLKDKNYEETVKTFFAKDAPPAAYADHGL